MSTLSGNVFGHIEGELLPSTQIDILLSLVVLLWVVVEGTLVEFPAAGDVGDGSGDKKDRRPPITQDECRRTAAAAAANNPLASTDIGNELVEWRLYLDMDASFGGNKVLLPCDCC